MDALANDGVPRDIRRYRLAWKLMTYGVRTEAITAMTKFSRHQQKTLRRRWSIATDTRRRGPSPTSVSRFIGSARARCEGGALAAFCRLYGALPPVRTGVSRDRLLSLEFGERLCHAYAVFTAGFPGCKLNFESTNNLLLSTFSERVIRIGQCCGCGAIVLIDQLAPNTLWCGHCCATGRPRARPRPGPRSKGPRATGRR